MSKKSKVLELTQSANMAAIVWQKLEEAVERNYGLLEDLDVLTQPEGVSIIDTVVKQLVATRAMQRNLYVVPVNYSLSHAMQITAGKFTWISSYDRMLVRLIPSEHLVTVPSGKIKQYVRLLHLNREASTEQALAEMKKHNLRPTTSHETLAFAATHPEVHQKFPVIGLGSVWVSSTNMRCVLGLSHDFNGSGLNLEWCDGKQAWHCRHRFLAIRLT